MSVIGRISSARRVSNADAFEGNRFGLPRFDVGQPKRRPAGGVEPYHAEKLSPHEQ